MSTSTEIEIDVDHALREEYHHHASVGTEWSYGGPPVETMCGLAKRPDRSAPDACCPMCAVLLERDELFCGGVAR